VSDERFDELDEALFALSLEEPPADLRASILQATIHAPAVNLAFASGGANLGFAPEAAAERAWNPVVAGVGAAVLAWLCLAIFADRDLARTIVDAIGAFVHLLGEPATIPWLALGAASAAAVQIADAWPKRLTIPGGRA
jgi:hypothetical protein